MCVYGSSHPICDGDEGVYFPSLFCRVLISGLYLMCLCLRVWSRNLLCPGCESFELYSICGGGNYWCLVLVWGSYYAKDVRS